ncbi:hypothetical protein P152DRAFT_106746 [Eremomyces bilateralis CBS 781.70]|uniref:Uncharacterized protein n=1 Tax=Eremomyces bilateralis CBS 781.70 TaxID=1392243 RepID=A0A6G1FX09_9PEZI|nr:uncharacterized protein P152DRAFT_106746 [Eremomyces bilateralis CBS 781.70]KAF1810278.1 hypothetical protein P152DRAFT_106746 [Eremomyces bilateralis CBS 781.70]
MNYPFRLSPHMRNMTARVPNVETIMGADDCVGHDDKYSHDVDFILRHYIVSKNSNRLDPFHPGIKHYSSTMCSKMPHTYAKMAGNIFAAEDIGFWAWACGGQPRQKFVTMYPLYSRRLHLPLKQLEPEKRGGKSGIFWAVGPSVWRSSLSRPHCSTSPAGKTVEIFTCFRWP